MVASSDRFWLTCEKYRFLFLSFAAICIILLFYNYWWNFNIPKQKNNRFFVYGTLNALHIWLIILAAAGFVKRYLNFTNSFLQYANQAVYPLYIIHQTIIVALGYYVVQWQLPAFMKLTVLTLCSFLSVFIAYHYFIRPFIVTRILFGMKLKKKQKDPQLESGADIIM